MSTNFDFHSSNPFGMDGETEAEAELLTGEAEEPETTDPVFESIRALLAQIDHESDLDDDVDEDEDDEDEDDEDEDEDGEEDEDKALGDPSGSIGQRVLLRREFRTNRAYCIAVVKSIQGVLRKMGVHMAFSHTLRSASIIQFEQTVRGVNLVGRVVVEHELCNIHIQFKFYVDNRDGRTPLIDHFCQERNFLLRYGSFTMDHQDGEKKLEYSTCFYGAFAEETFQRYWFALNSTLHVYADDLAQLAGGKKLTTEQRKLVRTTIGELTHCLPSRIKPEYEAAVTAAAAALGGNLNPQCMKLLNFIAEHGT